MSNDTTSKSSARSSAKTSQDITLEGMLVQGEEIILKAELHKALYWKAVAVFILAFFMLVIGITPFFMLLGLVGAVMLSVAILTQHYLLLAVTNKRVLARYGLLQMDVVDIRLSKIESIDLERMLPGHMFGYANVVVMGTGQRVIRVPYIANAEAFRRFYNEMVLVEEGSEEADEAVKQVKEQELDAQQSKKSSSPKKKV